jgi:hypothetical protein
MEASQRLVDIADYELNEIAAVDTTSFVESSGDRASVWYVISTDWLSEWVAFVTPSLIKKKTSRHDFSLSNERPGIINNDVLFNLSTLTLQTELKLKRDYRVINEQVWGLFFKWYGCTCPPISFTGEDGLNNPSKWSYEKTFGKLQLNLVPHVHTLKCNRKKFVCTSPGTYREREKVIVKLGDASVASGDQLKTNFSLYRGKFSGGKRSWENMKWTKVQDETYKCSTSEPYTIKLEDNGCYLQVRSANRDPPLWSNVAGPCTVHPPIVDDVIIEGTPVVGNVLKAHSLYWGGTEGPSEYCWIRVLNGKREKFETRPCNASTRFEDLDTKTCDDVRVYKLTEADIGAKLKVQVNPIRSDGQHGESKTSLPTKKIMAESEAAT